MKQLIGFGKDGLTRRHGRTRVSLVLAICAFVVGCTPGTPRSPGPTTPKGPSPQAPPPQLAAPEGDFFADREISEYDPMTEEDTVIMTVDVVTIERAPNGALQVRLTTYGRNWSECWFEETMIPSGPNEWRWKMTDPNVDCVVVLTQTKSEIAITSSDDCDSQFCGHRAYLQSTFLMSDRHPVGTYDWSAHP